MLVNIVEDAAAFEAMLEQLKQTPVIALDTETVGKESLQLFKQADECERGLAAIAARIEKAERVYRAKFNGRNKRASEVIKRFNTDYRGRVQEAASLRAKAKDSPSGLQFWNCYIGMLQLATDSAVYLIRPGGFSNDYWGRLQIVLNDALVLIIHNAQFDYKILKYCLGITLHCRNLWDTFIVERLITNGKDLKCGLKNILSRRLAVDIDKSIRVCNWLGEWTPEMVLYGAADVSRLACIKNQQRQELISSGQWKVYEQERKLLPINANMEMQGLGIDINYLLEIAPEVKRQVEQLHVRCCSDLGVDNPNSSPQVLAALQKSGLKVKDTNKKTLTKFEEHPLVALLLDYRKYAKLASTYLIGFVALAVNVGDHYRLFANFNPTGPDSGRWSSSDPNLQNLPASTVEL